MGSLQATRGASCYQESGFEEPQGQLSEFPVERVARHRVDRLSGDTPGPPPLCVEDLVDPQVAEGLKSYPTLQQSFIEGLCDCGSDEDPAAQRRPRQQEGCLFRRRAS